MYTIFIMTVTAGLCCFFDDIWFREKVQKPSIIRAIILARDTKASTEDIMKEVMEGKPEEYWRF